jgi:hypothetical protein
VCSCHLEMYPGYCHVFKSNIPSSKRTHNAAVEFKASAKIIVKHITHHRRHICTQRKAASNLSRLQSVHLNNACRKCSITDLEIRNQIVVFDGGNEDKEPIQPPEGVLWKSYHITCGSLWIVDTNYSSKGFYYGYMADAPTFIRLPRVDSLKIMTDSRKLCNAMMCCIAAQGNISKRGDERHVFLEENGSYNWVGSHAGRAERGVQSLVFTI